ncbi:GNAT family N-acetyltransferase [Peribacillus sp. SCS-26]|uniref:GNAT family N-acetyltransferase n=1 Tax=Paraperibacillus marinus TaxID=3115295 RepID=UPI003906D52B
MKQEMMIQEYKPAFQPQILELISHIQQVEYGIPLELSEQPDLYAIQEVYQSGKGNFWTAYMDGTIIGTTALQDIGNDRAALKKVFVHEEFRGKTYGVSAALLKTALKWAEEKSIKEVLLGTTSEFVAAHKFYEKNGFIRIAEKNLPENFPKLKVDTRFYKYII